MYSPTKLCHGPQMAIFGVFFASCFSSKPHAAHLLHMCLHNMANLGPLTAEIGSGVCGTPANFNGFRILPSLLQRRCSPEANQTLHDVCPSPGLVHYIYIYINLHFRGGKTPESVYI